MGRSWRVCFLQALRERWGLKYMAQHHWIGRMDGQMGCMGGTQHTGRVQHDRNGLYWDSTAPRALLDMRTHLSVK